MRTRLALGVLLVLVFVISGCAVRRGVVHEVKRGQTLWRISQVYGVELDDLIRVNGIENVRAVRPGTQLVIPGASRPRTVPRTALADASSRDRSRSGRAESSGSSRSPPERPRRSRVASSSPGSGTTDIGDHFQPVWPCKGRLASRFRSGEDPARRGIRIHVPRNAAVRAAEEGKVKLSGPWNKLPELGNIVIIYHGHDIATVYAHMKSVTVDEGDTVKRGQRIGTAGQSGEVDRAVCYFEVRYKLEPRDPLIFLGEPA